MRTDATDAERVLWRELRAGRSAGCKFKRQQPLGNYIVDFISFESKLVVEVDGGQHDEQRDYDTRRDAWLAQQGFRVLRFWNNEVMGNLEGVMETILAALKPPSPRPSNTPLPSPLVGEGEKLAPLSPRGRGAGGEGAAAESPPSPQPSPIKGEGENLSPLSPRGRGAGGEGAAAKSPPSPQPSPIKGEGANLSPLSPRGRGAGGEGAAAKSPPSPQPSPIKGEGEKLAPLSPRGRGAGGEGAAAKSPPSPQPSPIEGEGAKPGEA
ncbi:MAG: endonuclease domain-containing protein [Rhodocyclales bacterium]|nr:endonuclease domain-containing protein [Rhodocyclales bacterium]